MSCNEWEAGELSIPSAEWPAFKAKIREAWNSYQEKRLAQAERLYTEISTSGAKIRNVNWHQHAEAVITRMEQSSSTVGHDDAWWWLLGTILPYERRSKLGSAGAPLKPKKKDFPPATGSTQQFQLGEASITFDEKRKVVTWNVPGNNRAVESARRHSVAKAFFKALDTVKWTRGSGGEITGNNEYHREDKSDGGGANFVKARYGAAATRYAKEITKITGRASRTPAYRW